MACIVMHMFLQMILNSMSTLAGSKFWVKGGVIWVRDLDQFGEESSG